MSKIRRGVLEKSFFNQFFGVNFEAGNEFREKNCFVAELYEERSEKRVVFLFKSLFSRKREVEA